jgi:hypothetical protein
VTPHRRAATSTGAGHPPPPTGQPADPCTRAVRDLQATKPDDQPDDQPDDTTRPEGPWLVLRPHPFGPAAP